MADSEPFEEDEVVEKDLVVVVEVGLIFLVVIIDFGLLGCKIGLVGMDVGILIALLILFICANSLPLISFTSLIIINKPSHSAHVQISQQWEHQD